MSDTSQTGTERVAEQCYAALDRLRDIETETEEQREKIDEAIEAVEWVAQDDKDKHGKSPTDHLIEHLQKHRGGSETQEDNSDD
jgi:hypothetical protein